VPCRVYTHHYEQYMEMSVFDHAAEVMANITAQYAAADTVKQPPPITRMRPRGLSFL
jgi:tubulin epsilon